MFGGGFGSSGFGTNQPQQQPQTPGFAGFGSTFGQPQQQQQGFGTATPAFGAPQTTPAFGSTPAFGGSQPSSGFGSNFGSSTPAFGSTANTGFGAARPAFGAPASTPGFVSTNTTGNTTGFGFGASAQQSPSAFGMGTQNVFGGGAGQTNQTQNNGTGSPSYAPTHEKDATSATSTMNIFHTISAMPAYRNWSFEELRAQDYTMGKKHSTTGATGTTTGFGQPSTGFGTTPSTGFGSNTGTSMFGQSSTAPKPFGTTGSMFGQTPQAPQASTGFGFGQTPQQPAQTGSIFGSTTTTPAFGQPAQTSTPGFGSATGGMFGQPAQPSTTPAFGQPQQQTGFGFGSTPAATGTFGSGFGATPSTGTTGGLFGKPATTQPSAFGTTPAPTGMFGQPAAPATSTGGGLFGTGATSTAPSTGLFGQKPATSLFGAPQPSTGFGTTPASGTSIFGAAAPATSTAPTVGAFGQPATSAPSTGLFGQQPAVSAPSAFSFGAPTAPPQPSTGFGSTLLGAPKPATGFGFGSTPAASAAPSFNLGQPSTTPSLFGTSTTPAAGSSLFGIGSTAATTGTNIFGASTLGASQQATQLQASIDKNPYGNNPLFAIPATPGQTKDQPTAIPLKIAEPKKPPVTPSYKMTPKSSTKMTLRGFSPVVMSTNEVSVQKSQLFSNVTKDDQLLSLDPQFQPRRSVRKLIVDDSASSSVIGTPSSVMKVSGTPRKKDTILFDREKEASLLEKQNEQLAERSDIFTPIPNRIAQAQTPSTKAKSPMATIYDFYPPLSELMQRSEEELKSVSDFEVSLSGVGSVRFLRPVDLISASPTGDKKGISKIPGVVILLEPKSCTVYPDETVKPPVGFGLNVPAEIELSKCWPIDKDTRQPITDIMDPRMERHVKKLQSKPDTTYIRFSHETGTWKFRVDHFSRYGLDEDEEEEEVVPMSEDPTSVFEDSFAHIKSAQKRPFFSEPPHESPKRILGSLSSDEEAIEEEDLTEEESYLEDEESFEEDELSFEEELLDESFIVDTSAVDQSLTFGNESISVPPSIKKRVSFMDSEKIHFYDQDTGSDIISEEEEEEEESILVEPDVVRILPKLSASFIYQKINTKAAWVDPRLALSRSFRVGWSNDGRLISIGSISPDGYHYSTLKIQSLPGLAIQSPSESQAHVEMLKCIKQYNFESPLSFGYILENIQKRSMGPIISTEELSIWKLGSALFDAADVALFLETDNEEKQKVVESSVRKEVVSRWLKEACREALAEDLSLTSSSVVKVYIYLTGRLCAKAVDECLKARLYKLALLIAQQGGAGAAIALNHGGASGHLVPGRGGMDETTRDLIDEQIKLWAQEDWTSMDKNLLRLWKVCSGNPEHWDESIFAQLDWKRAFGMFLWYYKGGWCSLAEAVEAYQEAYQKTKFIAQPILGSDVDIHFELLKLLSHPDYPLQKVLHPATRGRGHFDLRVSWILRLMLSHRFNIDSSIEGVDSDVWSVKISDDITVGYALQLESEGLWLWGCYVLSFLQDPLSCEQATREMIARNYPWNDTTQSITAEFPGRTPTSTFEWDFLVNELNVPPRWIFEAKALKAKYQGCEEMEAAALIDAGLLTPAYHLVMIRLAPKAIAQDEFEVIRLLLNRLTDVQHWNLGGGLLLDYFSIYSEAKTLMDDAVDLSQDQKQNLIQRLIHLLKQVEELYKEESTTVLSTTFVEREFGKEAANAVSNMLHDISNRLVNLIHDIEESIVVELSHVLPVSQDLRLEEMHGKVNQWFNDFFTQQENILA